MPKKVDRRLLKQFPELAPVLQANNSMRREFGRYGFYDYLTNVYRVARGWSKQKIRKRRTRQLKQLTNIVERKRLHTFRTIMNATAVSLDAKTASRWTRSLELAALENVPSAKLALFIRKKGGIVKCARAAASEIPKRRYRRKSSWD